MTAPQKEPAGSEREAPMTIDEFFAEARRIGLTAEVFATQLAERPEFADCLPAADMRGRFEKWARERGHDTHRSSGTGYLVYSVQIMWMAWQEASASQPSGAAGEVTDAQAHAILLTMAHECDDWAERLSEDPTEEQVSGKALSIIRRELSSLASPSSGGWQWVPVEPTPAMVEAGAAADPERESVWAAYLAAAPKSSGESHE